MKRCPTCEQHKPLDDFHKLSRSRDGHHRTCKACRTAEMKARYDADPESAKRRSAQWRTANPERVRAQHAKRRATKAEHIRAMHKAWRDTNRDHVRQYARDRYSPERQAHYHRTRRAKKAGAVPQRWRLSECDPLACYWCGRGLLGAAPEIDHVMPISRCGPADMTNEVMACFDCNRHKSNKHPLVWIAQLV